jgi:hypothetical protein
MKEEYEQDIKNMKEMYTNLLADHTKIKDF